MGVQLMTSQVKAPAELWHATGGHDSTADKVSSIGAPSVQLPGTPFVGEGSRTCTPHCHEVPTIVTESMYVPAVQASSVDVSVIVVLSQMRETSGHE
jgi:hypothetical protein